MSLFLDEETPTTNFSIKLDDDRLDPNQFFTGVSYYKYDHNSKVWGVNQIVQKFKEFTKSQEKGDE